MKQCEPTMLNNLSFIRPFSASANANWFGLHRHGSLARAGVWSALATNVEAGLQIVSAIIMARVLEPHYFGQIAIVMTIYNLLSQLTSNAIANAAIQKHDLTEQQASNFFWINLAITSAFGITLASVGPVLAWFYRIPELNWLALVFGLLLILDGSSVVHRGLLKRSMSYDFFFWNTLFIGPLAIVVSVWMAWIGCGVFSLAGASFAGGILFRISLFRYVGWKPLFYKKGAGLRQMVKFGSGSAMAFTVDFIYRQSQVLLLGRVASAEDVGHYNRGQALFERPFGQLLGPILQVFLPAIAAKQHDPVAINGFVKRATWLIGLTLLPLDVFVLVCGEHITVFVLGARWAPAGQVMSCFALSFIPWILYSATFNAVGAMGHPARGVTVRLCLLPVFVAATLWAGTQGPAEVAFVYAAVMLITFIPMLKAAVKGTPLMFSVIALLVAKVLLCGFVSFLLLTLLNNHISRTLVCATPIQECFLLGGLALLSYFATWLTALLDADAVWLVRHLLRRFRSGRFPVG
jgi:PST family polysaccharide transporter